MKKTIFKTAIIASTFAVTAKDLTSVEVNTYHEQSTKNQVTQSKANKVAGASFVSVGDTNDCDFRLGVTKIQDALDFAESDGIDEVRVAQGTYEENIIIDDFSVVLKGGYEDCAAAELDNQTLASPSTVIDAATPTSVIMIMGNTQRNFVTIDTIQATGGLEDGPTFGGGLVSLNSDVSLMLKNVSITNSFAVLGGGLALVSGKTDVSAFNLMIINNQASQGGGIYCNGDAGSTIFIDGDENNSSGIFNNQATDILADGNGGGIYAEGGCVFTSYVGTSGGSGDLRGIAHNSAAQNGGGIYAIGGSRVNLIGSQFCLFSCNGYNTHPVNINNNTAGWDGGGIYAAGADTSVNLFNVSIHDNFADQGGGISLDFGANLSMNSILSSDECWSPGSCSQINNNTAVRNGGAIHAGGPASINRVHIQGNRADFGTALYVRSTVDTEGLLVTGNGNNGTGGLSDSNVINVSSGASITLAYSTVADNNIPDANEIVNNVSGSVRLLSTIVHEPNPVAIYTASSPTLDTFDCMVVHEDDSLIASGSTFNIIEDDPEFIDRGAGDYHIDPATSPALDSCDTVVYTPEFNDSDNDERGFDWPGVTNNLGPYDVGYDEQSDLIFANGLEAL